jgi:hypothetical protein
MCSRIWEDIEKCMSELNPCFGNFILSPSSRVNILVRAPGSWTALPNTGKQTALALDSPVSLLSLRSIENN